MSLLVYDILSVTYASRTAAEFAKEAMHDRPLLPGPKGLLDPECNIRWMAAKPGQGEIHVHSTRGSFSYTPDQHPAEELQQRLRAGKPALEAAVKAPLPRPLPQNWQAVEDQTTGHTYYCNPITGQTQWELPTAAASEGAALWVQVTPHLAASSRASSVRPRQRWHRL
jgi:hypothetical protein